MLSSEAGEGGCEEGGSWRHSLSAVAFLARLAPLRPSCTSPAPGRRRTSLASVAYHHAQRNCSRQVWKLQKQTRSLTSLRRYTLMNSRFAAAADLLFSAAKGHSLVWNVCDCCKTCRGGSKRQQAAKKHTQIQKKYTADLGAMGACCVHIQMVIGAPTHL